MRTTAWVLWLAVASALPVGAAEEVAEKPLRDPVPEHVTVFAGVGFLAPSGRLGEDVDGGVLAAIGGFYELNQHIAPMFSIEYSPLEPDVEAAPGGSLDTWRIVAGLRLFLLPKDYSVRPWIGGLGGWAHYKMHPRRFPLEPIIADRRDTRDDPLISVGGGVDFRLHPNFSVGLDLRHGISLTNDSQTEERDLHAFGFLATALFHY